MGRRLVLLAALALASPWSAAAAADHASALAAAPPPDSTPLSPPQWTEQLRARCVIPDAPRLQAAKDLVLQALQQLDASLSDEPLEGWLKRVCRLDELSAQLAAAEADPETLDQIRLLLRRRQPGRDDTAMARLRDATARYANLLRMQRDQGVRDQFLVSAQLLGSVLASPDLVRQRATEAAVREAYTLLASSGLADDLLTPFRQRMSRPNNTIVVRETFLTTVAPSEGALPVTFNESMQGTQVTGKGDAHYRLMLDFRPNADQAELLVRVTGNADIPVTARKKPVTIKAQGRLQFAAEEAALFDGQSITTGDPTISADYHSQMRALCLDPRPRVLRLFRPLVRRIAGKKLAEGDQQASRKVKTEVATILEKEGAAIVDRVNALADHLVWRTLEASDIDPQLHAVTREDALTLTAEVVGAWQLGALTDPLHVEGADLLMTVALHESALNHLGELLAGRLMDDHAARQLILDNLGMTPQFDEPPQRPRRPTRFRFADSDPLTAELDGDRISVTVRIQEFELDGQSFNRPLRTARVTYAPRPFPGGAAVEREGPIVIQPEDEQLLQTLQRFFPASARTEPSDSPGEVKVALSHFAVQQGWATFGLSKPSTPKSGDNQRENAR